MPTEKSNCQRCRCEVNTFGVRFCPGCNDLISTLIKVADIAGEPLINTVRKLLPEGYRIEGSNKLYMVVNPDGQYSEMEFSEQSLLRAVLRNYHTYD